MKEGQVLKLQKALYGLKQAGRRWYKTLETILKTKGLQRSEYDQAVFYHKREHLNLIVFIHVDDITIIGRNIKFIDELIAHISKYVAYTNDGDINWLLGIKISYNWKKRTIKLWQKNYIDTIIKRY